MRQRLVCANGGGRWMHGVGFYRLSVFLFFYFPFLFFFSFHVVFHFYFIFTSKHARALQRDFLCGHLDDLGFRNLFNNCVTYYNTSWNWTILHGCLQTTHANFNQIKTLDFNLSCTALSKDGYNFYARGTEGTRESRLKDKKLKEENFSF